MTHAEYRARIRNWGCVASAPSVNGHTVYRRRESEGGFVRIPDPEILRDDELEDVLTLLEQVHGLTQAC